MHSAGSRLSEASTISGDPGNGTAALAYDALGRLTSYALPGIRTLGAAWQEVPSRSSLTTDGTPVAQSFDAANRPSDNGYASDADGRIDRPPGERRLPRVGQPGPPGPGPGQRGRRGGGDIHL